jgi:hypothetical protein
MNVLASLKGNGRGRNAVSVAKSNLPGPSQRQSLQGGSFEVEDRYGLADRDFNDQQAMPMALEINGIP